MKSHEIGVQMRRVKESDRFWKLAGRWRIDEPGLLVQASDGADGVDCYRMNGTNHVLILMPSLDWFPVIRENIFVGRREVYFNIRIEQDLAAELFLPPAGTPVIAGFEPRKRPPVVGQ